MINIYNGEFYKIIRNSLILGNFDVFIFVMLLFIVVFGFNRF